MNLSNLPGFDEAVARIHRYKTARTNHLETLEKYVSGEQYHGRPDWFSAQVPLWERAPCVVYPIAKAAIESNVDLLLGEQTFPSIYVPHSDDVLEDSGLSADDAELVNRWMVEFEQYTRLRAIAREMFYSAQGCGSACAIVGIRSGRPVIDTTKAAWCTPTLDGDGNVTDLTIEYPYLEQYQAADGSWCVRAMVYRRVIDAQRDVTFKPAKLDGTKLSWSIALEIVHGLGFAPVVWYSYHKRCSTVADIDGKALHAHLLDEITALDFTLSQRHRAALYAGDPQWTEIGVEPGFNPSTGGRPALATPATRTGEAVSPTNPVVGMYLPAQPSKIRKKSPGDVWQYENPDAKVQLHTLPGDALTALDNHAADLKRKISEALGVVFIDPENIPRGGELSAKAMNALRARQLDRCDSNRSDFGDFCLRPLLSMLFRIVCLRSEGLKIPGLKKVKPLLTQLQERGLMLRLDWGPYARPEPSDVLALVQAASLALEGGIATVRSAVLMTKEVLGVEDVDEHVELLAKEAEERQAKAMEQVAAEAKATGGHPQKPQTGKDAIPKGSAGTSAASKA